MFTYIKMSKALVPIIAVIALFVCMCCVLSLAGGTFAAFSDESPAPAPSPPASSSASSSDDDDDDADDDDADQDEPEGANAAEPPAAADDDDDEPEGENLPKLSTNGRCGPNHGKTRCGGKACCSQWGWCGGEQGKRSAWCSGTDKGHWGGEYDGRG